MGNKFYEILDFDEQYLDYLFKIHKENFMEYFVAHYGKWNDNRQFKSFYKMVNSGNYKMIKYKEQIIGLLNYQKGVGRQDAKKLFWDDLTALKTDQKHISWADYIIPAQIRYINIDKKYQGQGIGTAILKDIVEDCLHKSGYPAILKVYRDNPYALKLYKSVGLNVDEKHSDEHHLTMRLDLKGYHAVGGRNAPFEAPKLRQAVDDAFEKQ